MTGRVAHTAATKRNRKDCSSGTRAANITTMLLLSYNAAKCRQRNRCCTPLVLWTLAWGWGLGACEETHR